MTSSPPDTGDTSTGHGSPAAEIEITDQLVKDLLTGQHPDLAQYPVQQFENGFDNVIYRLGEAYAIRLLRRAAALPFIQNEQKWLKHLRPHLPLPIPSPIRTGNPTSYYPWPWSILPWFDGTPVDEAPLSPSQAAPLARFLKALHIPAPANAPLNDARGVPIAVRQAINEERMNRINQQIDVITPEIRHLWNVALAATPDTSPTWLHGDLHARNVLSTNGRITAIIDWGDTCVGDRATDLACLWSLLDCRIARREAMKLYGNNDPALWARSRGWAIMFGAALLDTGLVDHPRHTAMGKKIFQRLHEDALTQET